MLEFGQKNEICDKMAPGLLANLSFCQVKKIDFFNPGEKLAIAHTERAGIQNRFINKLNIFLKKFRGT